MHPDWKMGLISHDPTLAVGWGRQIRRIVEDEDSPLDICIAPYKSVNDVLKDQAYKADYQFYLYSSGKGYSLVRPSLTGLLAKFSKDLKRPIKKELRKNRIRVVDEASFVLAWKCINESGFQPIFYAD